MKVVLDTNVLLVSISRKSALHWIFEQLIEGRYRLCVTTDILAEYAEIIGNHMGEAMREAALGVLENLPNVEKVTVYFKFEMLRDPEDNKFVDCAIAAGADYIVSHDRDFDLLNNVDFPTVRVLSSSDFKNMTTP